MAEDKSSLDFRMVPISDIEAAGWNPNEMEAEMFETLVNAIREEGTINQPVLVRRHPNKKDVFQLVDGEHRYKGAKVAGLNNIGVIVVNYDETQAKIRTLSMNAVRGQNVPIKLARLIVDLQKTYSDAQIRAMTGIGEDQQSEVLKLLEVPEFRPDTGVHISTEQIDRPLEIKLMLMPDEHGAYTAAMKKAMKFSGEDVTVLVGTEVPDYNKAMSDAMGIAGVKLRNVALAAICRAFLDMPADVKERAVASVKKDILDKRSSDAEQKEQQLAKTDKAAPARTRVRG